MNTMMRVMAFAAFALALSASAQQSADTPRTEPIKFRGAYVGEPLSDFITCPGKQPIDQTYKVHGKLCEEGKGSLSNLKHYQSWGSVAQAMGTNKIIQGGGYDGMELTFTAASVSRIVIRTSKESDWDHLLSDLVTKIGPPDRTMPQTFQNSLGAHWDFPKVGWIKDGVAIVAGVCAENMPGDKTRIQTEGTKVLIERAPADEKPLL